MRSLFKPIYKRYRQIFPKIDNVRGTTRLRNVLRWLAYGSLDKINEEPEGIFEKENWDNLIILDALRHDKYEEVTRKDVPYRITKGSMTKEFVEKNFSEGNFNDVVYITANGWITEPMLPKLIGRDNPFHTIYETILESWDEDIGAVHPADLVTDAISAQKLFPEKKKIIHFGQPHLLFIHNEIGDTRKGPLSQREGSSEFELARKGKLSNEDLIKGYEKNLELVLEHVERLVEQLDGKTVLTSDHGELLGEKEHYSHPYGKKYKLLRKVPWVVLND